MFLRNSPTWRPSIREKMCNQWLWCEEFNSVGQDEKCNPPGEPTGGLFIPVTTTRKLTTVYLLLLFVFSFLFLSGDAPLILEEEEMSSQRLALKTQYKWNKVYKKSRSNTVQKERIKADREPQCNKEEVQLTRTLGNCRRRDNCSLRCFV